jgi:hypothetical protein
MAPTDILLESVTVQVDAFAQPVLFDQPPKPLPVGDSVNVTTEPTA